MTHHREHGLPDLPPIDLNQRSLGRRPLTLWAVYTDAIEAPEMVHVFTDKVDAQTMASMIGGAWGQVDLSANTLIAWIQAQTTPATACL